MVSDNKTTIDMAEQNSDDLFQLGKGSKSDLGTSALSKSPVDESCHSMPPSQPPKEPLTYQEIILRITVYTIIFTINPWFIFFADPCLLLEYLVYSLFSVINHKAFPLAREIVTFWLQHDDYGAFIRYTVAILTGVCYVLCLFTIHICLQLAANEIFGPFRVVVVMLRGAIGITAPFPVLSNDPSNMWLKQSIEARVAIWNGTEHLVKSLCGGVVNTWKGRG